MRKLNDLGIKKINDVSDMYSLGGYMSSTNNLSYIENFSNIILKIKDRKPNVIFGNGFSIDYCLEKLKEVNLET